MGNWAMLEWFTEDGADIYQGEANYQTQEERDQAIAQNIKDMEELEAEGHESKPTNNWLMLDWFEEDCDY